MNKKPFILGIIVGVLLTILVVGSTIKIVEWNNLKDKPRYESWILNDVDIMVSQLQTETNINLFIKTDSLIEYYQINELRNFEKYLGGNKELLHNRSDHRAYECDTHTFEKRLIDYNGLNSEWNIVLFEDSNCSAKYPPPQ